MSLSPQPAGNSVFPDMPVPARWRFSMWAARCSVRSTKPFVVAFAAIERAAVSEASFSTCFKNLLTSLPARDSAKFAMMYWRRVTLFAPPAANIGRSTILGGMTSASTDRTALLADVPDAGPLVPSLSKRPVCFGTDDSAISPMTLPAVCVPSSASRTVPRSTLLVKLPTTSPILSATLPAAAPGAGSSTPAPNSDQSTCKLSISAASKSPGRSINVHSKDRSLRPSSTVHRSTRTDHAFGLEPSISTTSN